MTTPRSHWSGVTVDCRDPVRLGAFWAGLLDLPTGDALSGWVRLGARGGDRPVLNFQPVPEPKVGKTRIHLDLTVEDLATGVARVIELGGQGPSERHDYDEGIVVVMADPEGNEFCLTEYFADR